jgi:hypothetical protein
MRSASISHATLITVTTIAQPITGSIHPAFNTQVPRSGTPAETSCVAWVGPTNLDLTLCRNFNLASDARVLTFRWEVYNAFNHTQSNTVDTTARFNAAGQQTNPTFGQAIGAYPARQMQFSLRLRF